MHGELRHLPRENKVKLCKQPFLFRHIVTEELLPFGCV
jgi:hypothetical protein